MTVNHNLRDGVHGANAGATARAATAASSVAMMAPAVASQRPVES